MTSPFSEDAPDTTPQLNMALDRIRQLSAHEVGHTLGIAHNFAASENERASVMDYPHPLFELVDGNISLANAYDNGIGEWDKFVIEYGYQDFASEQDESSALKELVAQAQAKGFLYKSDPDARIAKRASADGHLWDNGSNAIQEFERMSAVRDVALSQFGVNSLPLGEPLSSLEERFVPIYYSHRYQLDALVKQISGVNYYYEVKQANKKLQGNHFVSGEQQFKALDLMIESASADYLRVPNKISALINPKSYGSNRNRESFKGRMGIAFDPISAAEAAAGYSINMLLEPLRLNRLAYQHSVDKSIPSVESLTKNIFDKLIKIISSDTLEQRIRQTALSIYFDTMLSDDLSPDVKLQMQAQLLSYQGWLKKKDKSPEGKVLVKYIEHYWQSGVWLGSFAVKQLPPGSPI
jgi:hypothetical protein